MRFINLLSIIFAVIISASAPHAFAQFNPNIEIKEPQNSLEEKAMQVSQMQYPREQVVAQATNAILSASKIAIENNPTMAALNKQYPGIIDEIIKSSLPIITKAYEDKLPLLWANNNALYMNNFTENDLDIIITFNQSATGIKYKQLLLNNIDLTDAIKSASSGVEEGFGANAKKESDKALNNSVNKTNRQMTQTELVEVFKFENSNTGSKLGLITEDVKNMVGQWDFYFPDNFQQMVANVQRKAATKFMEEADAKAEAAASNEDGAE
ncbi:hypothetical protein LPB140_02965 [Sphingorhabdus lutea]|uniref:DUF2059 domain-containing protein n=1 Tax=Sphingorhabdus lutea TaxID=1913578 RepID=A0A1L3JA16_9SPHN|nr:hypothetical protein [Sphingorhabdus lutea]APG61958.1 hypothetical protein LPB140_02965 [Sphingorhabdus lutea]